MFGLLYLGSIVSQTVERRLSGRLSNCLHEMALLILMCWPVPRWEAGSALSCGHGLLEWQCKKPRNACGDEGARELGQVVSQTGEVLVDIDEGCGHFGRGAGWGVRSGVNLEADSRSGNSGETKSAA